MVYSEAFQEAFSRMERNTNARYCEDLDELLLVAESYFASKWIPSDEQTEALEDEARRRGYYERWKKIRIAKELLEGTRKRHQVISEMSWRYESVIVKGRPQIRYRDLKTGRFMKKP